MTPWAAHDKHVWTRVQNEVPRPNYIPYSCEGETFWVPQCKARTKKSPARCRVGTTNPKGLCRYHQAGPAVYA